MSSRRTDFGEVVASEAFDVDFPGDGTRRVEVRVGKPYQVSGEEWACPLELFGLEARHPDIRGGSSLQALGLALRLARSRLDALLEDGATFRFAGDRTKLSWEDLAAVFGGELGPGTGANDALGPMRSGEGATERDGTSDSLVSAGGDSLQEAREQAEAYLYMVDAALTDKLFELTPELQGLMSDVSSALETSDEAAIRAATERLDRYAALHAPPPTHPGAGQKFRTAG